MSKIFIAISNLLILVLFMSACGGGSDNNAASADDASASATESKSFDTESYDPKRGEGKFNEENVKVDGLDAAMAAKGKSISETKCFSCHKTTDERLVGPGWKGVTSKHSPFWIMNFITNPDPMIDKDPEVQAQLEICLVRMPNQNLSDDEARDILEFMRENDGAK